MLNEFVEAGTEGPDEEFKRPREKITQFPGDQGDASVTFLPTRQLDLFLYSIDLFEGMLANFQNIFNFGIIADILYRIIKSFTTIMKYWKKGRIAKPPIDIRVKRSSRWKIWLGKIESRKENCSSDKSSYCQCHFYHSHCGFDSLVLVDLRTFLERLQRWMCFYHSFPNCRR